MTIARYALRMEYADGTLEAAYHHTARKADAISAIIRAAKNSADPECVAICVEDTRTNLVIAERKVA